MTDQFIFYELIIFSIPLFLTVRPSIAIPPSQFLNTARELFFRTVEENTTQETRLKVCQKKKNEKKKK